MSYKSTNFFPIENKTINFAAETASERVEFTVATPANANGIKNYSSSLKIANRTSVDVFVAWGTDNTIEATVADSYQVGPGTVEVIEIGDKYTWIAVIPISSATGNVFLSKGRGA